MITLYGFGRRWGLPDPSPFVIKAEMLLKLAGLSYTFDTKGFRKAPGGKLPYIRDGAVVVADSTFIRLHIEKTYGYNFDAGLSPAEAGLAWSVEKMLEDHLYFLVMHERWIPDANFAAGPARFFDEAPALLRPLIRHMIRRKIVKTLWAQGTSRHSHTQIIALGARVFQSLSDLLGTKPYLMGEKPCGADATLYGFLSGTLCKIFETPLRTEVEKHPNLVAYVARMTQAYYPELKA